MKWIIRGEQALKEVGWQKKCTVEGVRKSCKWKGLTRDGRCVVVMKGLTKIKHRGKILLKKCYILSHLKTSEGLVK